MQTNNNSDAWNEVLIFYYSSMKQKRSNQIIYF